MLPTISRDIPASCTPTFTTKPRGTVTSTTTAPTPTPTQPNMVNGCTEFYQVESNDECGAIASNYDISLDDFYTWNPDVGEKCNALWLEYYVCVGGPASTSTSTTTASTTTSTTSPTPTPTQENISKNCTKFHKVESGDQCGTLASDNDISLDDFYSWNPDVGDECKSLWLGYFVCVGIS
ncbi:hypothetical protein BJX63DRAFT_418597 [Aspergillus granulosus]|uniref:LysM domain-containing protein n=1 Tax=Aspergillus granulosus TaxID=176169 RepID=A0ABR4HX25_9EURO